MTEVMGSGTYGLDATEVFNAMMRIGKNLCGNATYDI